MTGNTRKLNVFFSAPTCSLSSTAGSSSSPTTSIGTAGRVQGGTTDHAQQQHDRQRRHQPLPSFIKLRNDGKARQRGGPMSRRELLDILQAAIDIFEIDENDEDDQC